MNDIGVGLKRVAHYGKVAVGGLGITKGKPLAGPLNIQIGISDPCNHRCIMCWDHPPADKINEFTAPAARFGQRKPRLMGLDLFKGVIDDLVRLGTNRIDIVGRGEPLMNPDATEMLRYSKANDMEVLLISNGSLLTADIAQTLVDIDVDNLKVSLNAGLPDTYPKIHVSESVENYLKVISNLQHLSEQKKSAQKQLPHVTLSFCIGARNWNEIDDMVRAIADTGSNEGVFSHTIVHQDSEELTLTAAQLKELNASIPGARKLADELGVKTNLEQFEHQVPPYMDQEVVGPGIVPCYAGYYFALILGNGSVMFCCQCSESVDLITTERSFYDIWRSKEYAELRNAASALPETSDLLKTCECDQCALRVRNISIHNFIRPWDRIECGEDVRKYSILDVTRKWQGDYE